MKKTQYEYNLVSYNKCAIKPNAERQLKSRGFTNEEIAEWTANMKAAINAYQQRFAAL